MLARRIREIRFEALVRGSRRRCRACSSASRCYRGLPYDGVLEIRGIRNGEILYNAERLLHAANWRKDPARPRESFSRREPWLKVTRTRAVDRLPKAIVNDLKDTGRPSDEFRASEGTLRPENVSKHLRRSTDERPAPRFDTPKEDSAAHVARNRLNYSRTRR